MTMRTVVTAHEGADPLPCRLQVLVLSAGIVGAVFPRLEERFRIRVVIAHRRATERWHHTERLQDDWTYMDATVC